MGKLLNWIQLALEIRCEDVISRRDHVEFIKHDREQANLQQTERQQKFDQEISEAKAGFDEKLASDNEKDANDDEPKDKPKFDEEEFKNTFNEANPEVAQIDEPKEEMDNDYDLSYKPPAMDQEWRTISLFESIRRVWLNVFVKAHALSNIIIVKVEFQLF